MAYVSHGLGLNSCEVSVARGMTFAPKNGRELVAKIRPSLELERAHFRVSDFAIAGVIIGAMFAAAALVM